MSALSTNDIVDALLALLDELARRLDPDMATAVLREHGFNVSAKGHKASSQSRRPTSCLNARRCSPHTGYTMSPT
jgi:hypothetical protein